MVQRGAELQSTDPGGSGSRESGTLPQGSLGTLRHAHAANEFDSTAGSSLDTVETTHNIDKILCRKK